MKLLEVVLTKKAGFIPYYFDGDQLKMMFMIPSDAKYGGSKPSLSKGGVDPGETFRKAAIREAQEELGLRTSNVKTSTIVKVWAGDLIGLTEKYHFEVFAGEVKSVNDFDEPHFETGSTHWLTPKQFASKGRDSQKFIVAKAAMTLKR